MAGVPAFSEEMNMQDAERAELVDAAIREIESPSFGTRDFWAVHRVRRRDGHPVIVAAERDEDTGRGYVTFKIENERYLWTLCLEPRSGCLVPERDYVTPWSSVVLIVQSDELSPDVITGIIGLTPDKTQVKGERRLPDGAFRNETNAWFYELQTEPTCTPEEKVEQLLAVLSPVADAFANIKGRASVTITVRYEGYRDFTNCCVLQTEHIALLARLNAVFNFCFSLSGPDLPFPDPS